MPNMMVRVVTADGNISDIKLPIARVALEDVRSERRGFIADEEKQVIAFAHSVSVSGMPFPMDEDRFAEVANGGRTRSSEDYEIAGWVLMVWDVIEALRR